MYKRYAGSRYNRAGKRPAYRKTGGKSRPVSRYRSRNILTNIVDQVVRRTSELKFYPITGSTTFPVAGTYYADQLSDVAQGTTDQTRVGDRITAKSLTFRFTLSDFSLSLTANSQNFVRVLLVQWYPLVSSTPAITDILHTSSVLSSPNHDKRQMYRILYDRCLPLVGGEVPTNHYYRTVQIKIPRSHRQLQYNSGTTDCTNGLYVFAIAATQGAGVTAQLYWNSCFRYYDS